LLLGLSPRHRTDPLPERCAKAFTLPLKLSHQDLTLYPAGGRFSHGQRAKSMSRANTIWKRRLGSSPTGRTVRIRSDPSTSAAVTVKTTCE